MTSILHKKTSMSLNQEKKPTKTLPNIQISLIIVKKKEAKKQFFQVSST